MTLERLDLPVGLRANDLAGWLESLRIATGLPLELQGAGSERGASVRANGEDIASLTAPEAGSARLAEAARLLSLLSEERVAKRDLVAQTARLWKEQNFLTGVATSLGVATTAGETATRLLPRIVRLLGVERASVLLAREDGRLVVAAGHGTGSSTPVGTVVPEGGVADRVFRSAEPLLVEDTERLASAEVARALHGDARGRSFLSVPILSNGAAVGVINVTDRTAGRPFSAEDRKLVTAISAQVGIALANVRLLEDARRAEALKRELDLAARIQRTLLPRGPLHVPGFQVAGRCEPTAWVGGDGFEVVPRPAGGLWAAVFDVSGHGISAALLMASARATLRALLASDPRPAEAAQALDRLVASDTGDTGMFLTAALLRLDLDGTARLCSLGHPPALLRDHEGGLTRLCRGGPPAGVGEGEQAYEEDEVVLPPGGLLLLHTDGVTEAEGPSGPFGDAGVERALARIPLDAEHVVSGVLAAVYDHLEGRQLRDDVTALAVHRPANPARVPPEAS